MISYKPFWKTLKDANISQYTLIKKYNISPGSLQRLRDNKTISTKTVNELCYIFSCKVDDIMKFVP